jgi:SAM-dependent methyltransferase
MGSEPSKLKAETTYNAAADHFDDGPLAFWDRYGRRTVEQLHLLPGSSVLDVGCGSGASAIPAAVIVGPSGRVVGVDLAERLLDIARAKSSKQKLQNIEFRRARHGSVGLSERIVRCGGLRVCNLLRDRHGQASSGAVARGAAGRETCHYDLGAADVRAWFCGLVVGSKRTSP